MNTSSETRSEPRSEPSTASTAGTDVPLGSGVGADVVGPPAAPDDDTGDLLQPTLPGVSSLAELWDPSGPPPANGPLIGRYRLVHELGKGGMGVVYQAFDRDLRRHVALKLLRQPLQQQRAFVDRFVTEAQVTAQLQHPAIVPVYELSVTRQKELFYTMRLVRGHTLSALAQEVLEVEGDVRPTEAGRLTRFRLLETFVQVCRAIAYAHERSVVHRDLKPQNVMVGRHGEVHVLDWGLAKVLGAAEVAGPERWADAIERIREANLDGLAEASDAVRSGFTESTARGQVVGTPAYMAPEQARRDPGWLAPAIDVYALGGVLYAILTGRAPYRGGTTEILARLIEGVPPEPPRNVAHADVPEALDAACMQALDHDPSKRPASADALAETVEAYLEGRPAVDVRPEDSAYLAAYDPSSYRRPSVSVDVCVLQPAPEGGWRTILHRRQHAPFLGLYALPGGFFALEEGLEDAARRKLRDEAGLYDAVELTELGVFADPARDPRTRVIAVAYLALVPKDAVIKTPRKRDTVPAWFRVAPDGPSSIRLWHPDGRELPPTDLAFDHHAMLARALARAAARPG